MTLLRRVSYGALALAFAHIVFGAIVRITGSGLGCGDHWPRCHGYWFPPFTRMDLVIEVMHRYLAFGLSLTILGLLGLAFSRRREPGVSGPGGVLRPIALASVLVVTAALFGGIVVKLELRNKYIIVVHLTIAISTLAALAMATIRAGGLGGAQAVAGTASGKTWRAARVAAVMAFLAVVLGGLTAHVVGANGACVGFPHCPRGIGSTGAPLHIHLTHRVVAFLLFFHLLGMVIAVRKRRESSLMQWATRIAFGTVLLQILVAAALVELFLPPVLRSLHQAIGTLVWLSIFVLAALARRGSSDTGDGARLAPEQPRLAPEPDVAPRSAATVATVVATVAASAVTIVPTAVASAEPVPTAAAAPEPVVAEAESVVVQVAPVVVVVEPVAAAPEPVVVEAADDFDREVALRLEAVVGRDPFEDDDFEAADEAADVEEIDADEDFAAAIAAEFDEEEVAEADAFEVEVIEAEVIEAEPIDAAVAVPVLTEPPLALPVAERPGVIAEPVAAAVVPAQVAELPAAAKRPPTLAVLIARGADF